MNRLISFFIASLILTALVGLSGCVDSCFDTDATECPPPEAGITVNTIGVVKSVWFNESRTGDPIGHGPTLCRVDARTSPGMEITLRGNGGISIISHDEGSVTSSIFTPATRGSLVFVDFENDGNLEIVSKIHSDSDILEVWNEDGTFRWRRNLGIHSLIFFDITGDGTVEVLSYGQTVLLLDGDGSTLLELDVVTQGVAFADLDDDGEIELVTVTATTDESAQAATWELDGTMIASFTVAGDRSPTIVRAADQQGPERINFGCDVFDINGNKVSECEDFSISHEEYRTSHVSNADVDMHCLRRPSTGPPTTKVLTSGGSVAFNVEVTNSILTRRIINPIFLLLSPIDFHPVRTIVRIFDELSELVYEEVVESTTGQNSFTVIPADSNGNELLLVADETQIVAYQLGSFESVGSPLTPTTNSLSRP